MVWVVFYAMLINFIIPRLMPGGAMSAYTLQWEKLGAMDQAGVELMTERFGLDKPVLTQFGLYLKNSIQGDFGLSLYEYPTPVMTKIMRALPWTLGLMSVAMVITITIAYFLGVMSGWRAGSKRDSTIQGISVALMSSPSFWLSMGILYLFAYALGWFPLGGKITEPYDHANWLVWVGDWLRYAALPILTLALHFGFSQLIMRNTMVTTLREQYVLTAEAKGLSDNAVKFKHAARNALLPLVTQFMMRVATITGGMVFIEVVFSYPGMGYVMWTAVQWNDFPVVQGCFLMFAVVAVVMVFILDLVLLRLDPRIRF